LVEWLDGLKVGPLVVREAVSLDDTWEFLKETQWESKLGVWRVEVSVLKKAGKMADYLESLLEWMMGRHLAGSRVEKSGNLLELRSENWRVESKVGQLVSDWEN
jgi:hypothetical protein